MHNGRPAVFINGEVNTEPLYTVGAIDPKVDRQYYVQQMSKAGFKKFGIVTNCGQDIYKLASPVWIDEDTWDFSELDTMAHQVLAGNPEAKILVWLYIAAPDWWKEKYPNELEILDDGTTAFTQTMYPQVVPPGSRFESLASEKWRTDMAMSIRKVIGYIQHSDYGKNIYGYNIGALGTFEWYHWSVNSWQLGDYSEPMRKAFGKWLRDKYGAVENLRNAWNKKDIIFEKVPVPTKSERMVQSRTFRDPKVQMNVIDWNKFFSDIVVDTIDYFGGVVKNATNRSKIVSCYYGYVFEFRGNPEFGHLAVGKLLRSENIDSLLAPPSYFERQLGGIEGYRRPFFSATLHGKLLIHDNDVSSYLYPELMKKLAKKKNLAFAEQDFSTQLFPTATAQESIWHFDRANGFTLAEGIFHSYIDLHGGYYDHPKLLEAMKGMEAMLGRAKNYDRSSVAEVLVVADEYSLAYGTFQMDDPDNPYTARINHGLAAFQEGFIRSGTPFDCILMEDMPLVNLEQYKLIMFLNTYNVDDEMREFINEKVKIANRTVMWCYAPGLFNGNSESSENMEKLTGIKIVSSNDESFINPKYMLTEAGRAFMKQHGQQPINIPINMDIKVATVLRKLGEKEPENKNPEGKICKLISVKDSEAEVLGVLPGTSEIMFVKKKMSGWTSMYSIIPVMPADLVRAIAKSAGVHIYSESNDAFYANKSYLVIHAAQAGIKTIQLPYNCDIYNAMTEEKWYDNITKYDTSLMFGETQIFRYVTK